MRTSGVFFVLLISLMVAQPRTAEAQPLTGRAAAEWMEQANILAADGAASDQFGSSVSVSGDRALVGAPGDDDNGSGSGSAYVFDYIGGVWTATAKLTPADGAADDRFGYSVSLAGDRAIIGAVDTDDNGANSGSAYVFDFDGSTWNETAELTASDGVAGDQFGFSVSLSGDRALIGAPGDDDNGTNSGSAYIFDLDGSTWSETVKLTPADGSSSDFFSRSVSLSGDRALVGADLADANGTNSGSAYIFDFDGSTWSETVKLTPADGAASDQFGFSVSVSGDRSLIGAPANDDSGTNSGSAYVFDYDGSTWSETVKLTSADGTLSDFFGLGVSLSGDRALIGAPYNDDNGSASGSAYIFDYDGGTWSEDAKLTGSDGAPGDLFGNSVSLSGNRALIGADEDDDNGSNAGSVYVFDGITTLPVELATFKALRDGDAAVLTWSTLTETSNAGFEVQHRLAASGVWTSAAFIEGAGTTAEAQEYRYRLTGLEPGRHEVRLKQIDHDGAVAYSSTLEIIAEMPGQLVLEPAYPNPFNPQTTLRFGVRKATTVQVGLYDMLGRQVRVLYEGTPAGGTMQEVRVDGSGLTSGMYVVRLEGEGLPVQTQQLVLMK